MLVDSAPRIVEAEAKVADRASPLLAWYDRHRRRLPWRAEPGEPADPYRVWLSEIMLQQTTVAAVRGYFTAFVGAWPTVEALAAADEAAIMTAWAGLGYYARARNLIACARTVVRDHGGRFPDDEEGLRVLPGIGTYTAAAITAIAFGRRAVVVDANVERVVTRLFAVEMPLPAARPTIRMLADAITPDARAGDFAQAMMDLGATICTPRNPTCAFCPIAADCAARAAGTQETFPRKLAKRAKPVRHGTIFWLEREGRVLLVRRPAEGLLGGMRALPTGPWQEDGPGDAGAPAVARWRLAGHGRHVFTHFALSYAVKTAIGGEAPIAGEWWPVETLTDAGLPTLFAKSAAIAQGAGQGMVA